MIELGILTPVLSLVPGSHADWEQDAGIEEVRRIAETADRLGYGYLTCSEHIAIPVDGMDLPGPRYWDPLPTFGYLAAHTSRIRLTTSVLVLPYHHPLDIAKRYGALDRICGGRLVLGVGVGYLEPEFRMIGAPFEDRGARTDDAIRALRASFGRSHPSYDGEFFSFDGVVVDPCGLQEHVPLWVGGRTQRSLRRAVALGDGWCPFAVSPRRAAGVARRSGRDRGVAAARSSARRRPRDATRRRPAGCARRSGRARRRSAAMRARRRRRCGSSTTPSTTISSSSKR